MLRTIATLCFALSSWIALPHVAYSYTATGPCIGEWAWFVESRDGIRATYGPCQVPDEGSLDIACDAELGLIYIGTRIDVPGPDDAATSITMQVDGQPFVVHGSASFSAYLGTHRFVALLVPDAAFLNAVMSGRGLDITQGFSAHLAGARQALAPVIRACGGNP